MLVMAWDFIDVVKGKVQGGKKDYRQKRFSQIGRASYLKLGNSIPSAKVCNIPCACIGSQPNSNLEAATFLIHRGNQGLILQDKMLCHNKQFYFITLMANRSFQSQHQQSQNCLVRQVCRQAYGFEFNAVLSEMPSVKMVCTATKINQWAKSCLILDRKVHFKTLYHQPLLSDFLVTERIKIFL